MQKRGGIELSIGTVVVVVLSLSMLILGLVFVNKAMCGAVDGIDQINDDMKSQIYDLFVGDDYLVIKEKDNTIYAGIPYGVGFAIRNEGSELTDFSYRVDVASLGDCSFSEMDAMKFIIIGESGNVKISSGDDYVGLIRFDIPSNISPCKFRYSITVENGGDDYDFGEFDVEIKKKSFARSFCGN